MDKLKIKKIILDVLLEARDPSFITYATQINKVVAKLTKQKASSLTKLAQSWLSLKEELEVLEEQKKRLSELKKATEERENAAKSELRERILDLFNEDEQVNTLVAECLGATFSLSKFTEANEDKIITPKGGIVSTDYKRVVELILEQNSELEEKVRGYIRECSQIAEDDVIKKGRERSLRVNLKEYVQGFMSNASESNFETLINRNMEIKQLLVNLGAL